METVTVLSVRELVEFTLQGGSIDNRFGGFDRALEGAKIHRKLQKEAGGDYQSEVTLSHTCEYKGIIFQVEGRADGIFTENGVTTVDEIKTTGTPLSFIDEGFNRIHWAQAQCYAYFYLSDHPSEEIAVRLLYYHISEDDSDAENGQTKIFHRRYSLGTLEEFYTDLLRRYYRWAKFRQDWLLTRTRSAQALSFPFPQFRPGQRNLSVAVYRTVQEGELAFCQAPTGIGKTISTLFPSVKAMGEGLVEKIFYLTAKTITRQAAEDAVAHLRAAGLRLKAVTLTAKDKICFLEERHCNPQDCIYADGHYDRENDAIFTMLQEEDIFTREVLLAYAEKFRLCPFELSLDLSNWCDLIICDYNYLFDPIIYLKRYFSQKGDYAFLIDEAHNLVDRGREMYSSRLQKSAFLALKKECTHPETKDAVLSRALQKVNRFLIDLRKSDGEDFEQADALEEWNKVLERFSGSCERWLAAHRSSPLHAKVLELYFDVMHYLRIAELYDEHYITAVHFFASEVTVQQKCLDASSLLRAHMDMGKSTVLFSATLMPISYFCSTLGGNETSRKYFIPSPFPQDNLCLLIDISVNTKYQYREQSYQPIARRIVRMIEQKSGNYMVYFPSYQYMTEVYEQFAALSPNTETIMQESNMEEAEREAFLARFSEENLSTLVGFCVLGGIYSEGIDLKGDRLIGTMIVGVGLPQIGKEQDYIRAYYDKLGDMGFAFAYQYPGMNKVLQAAGRVIRSEQDRGTVILLDERFRQSSYRKLFPPHWSHAKYIFSEQELSDQLKAFWDR